MRKLSVAVVLLSSMALAGAPVRAQTPTPTPGSGERSLIKGFGITLLIGDAQGAASDALAPEAVKALADLKDFLPYKAYRELDKIWRLASDSTHTKLRGLGGQEHVLAMRSTEISPKITTIDMLRLWNVPVPPPPNPTPPFVPILIDTSFKIEVGETVVVGTSRLDGGRALILLVTAVPR